ncbi:MAG: DUF4058 family protein [Chloroflexota bacterium]|nr:DUF4058 family protein [Chloroflexota bacterium]
MNILESTRTCTAFWLRNRKWNRFHHVYIACLVKSLLIQLRPLGYYAEIEESLQIRTIAGELLREQKADILISDREHKPGALDVVATAPAAEMTLAALLQLEEPDHAYSAIGIRPRGSTRNRSEAEPITWIELLSPSNKGKKGSARKYLQKRQRLLNQRLAFIEIDTIHTMLPTFPALVDTIEQGEVMRAYRIAVLDPRPTLEYGSAAIYEFDVDRVIPTVKIPLRPGETLDFDFNALYQTMFAEMFYGDEGVDYTQFPLEFRRYSSDDQARIANRMLTVLRAAAAGVDLDASAPLPIEHPLPLSDALDAIAALTQTIPT